MADPREKDLKDLLEYLDGKISHHKKRLESSTNFGWLDKAELCRENLQILEPLRSLVTEHGRLVKKMEKWQQKARDIIKEESTVDDRNKEIEIHNMLYNFAKEISDFGKGEKP